MQTDNTTPMMAKEYDMKIEQTIPFYSEYYRQTIDLVNSLPIKKGKWLDAGCGTGEFVSIALRNFNDFEFVLCDPSEAMVEEAKKKLHGANAVNDIVRCGSHEMTYTNAFDIITAIQCHHYMQYEDRLQATKNCYDALKDDGVFVFFENFAPNSEYTRKIALDRWGRYQKDHGKSDEEVAEHIRRYGKNYFPITLDGHYKLLRDTGYHCMEIFWLSYMQVGIYAVK